MDCKSAIIGLGNPGPKYEQTRHNIGFMLVDSLVSMAGERKSMHLERIEESGDYALWRVRFAGAYRLLVKPMTYMNLSGKAVARICGRHGLVPEQLLVVHDELDLPFGRLKLKMGGGNNGHNGLKSIEEHLNTPEFFRLRMGIGRPAVRFADISAWVLEPFANDDAIHLPAILTHAIKGIDILHRRGISFAVQHINGFALETPDKTSAEPA
ncbi:aminoacyl-tRNA hydrolase [Pseudodesulfovibrio sp. F-1]|uniref:Peptidyl-tRNA hydrolase n=1 Tax=Pseudodesulfovibrio alkaliphilus TaxID=2661613 RepID=A0A7K1KP65_9BACT|nr:aminoacyl-tRNA hydrolase [Pseudodesulfovibrio alkaliphilus]MUM77896.1 aminoacyl-tRNA hydrolase [Pseudodesulfovibrio alkaliphilus]